MYKKNIFISIGSNCNPRIYMKNKMNITKKNGYKSCPFDLCISSFDSIYQCINDDFKYFFDELELIDGINGKGDRSNAGDGNKNIKNKYNFIFNHESPTHSHIFNGDNGSIKDDDEYFIRNDYEQFRKRYNDRINNFKNYMNEYTMITFLYNNYKKNEIEKLYQLMITKYKNKIIHFVKIE